jgi:lipopolysaccharide export system protein LptA
LRWQKTLRLAIAAFVVIFAAVVAVSFRRGAKPPVQVPAPGKLDEKETGRSGRGNFEHHEGGKIDYAIQFASHVAYEDGRQRLTGVKATLPDKNGRQITIEADEADITQPPGKQIGTGDFKGHVKLKTSDGVIVGSETAHYDDPTQMTTIPGALTFSKGRMTGTGVGATYDQNRAVLWILKDAKVDVAADPKNGAGAIHVTSSEAGMARHEHYMKFTGKAHMDGEGHILDADATTVYLTEDEERITRMELRGNSSIRSKPGGSGPQQMRANDIDVTYADDGRTLQSAHLVENALVRLPGEKAKAGKQITAKGIDVSLAPDGATVTNLTAAESVQVDLPAEGDTPVRRIRSALLIATGAPASPEQPGGIKNATFGGGVEFRETRPAKGKLAAIDRTAKSDKLDIQTKPGFGDLERADFHTNVHFTDGPQTTADAPVAVYDIVKDALNLSPGDGDKGIGPHVTDARIAVDAKNIQMGLSSQKMKADTRVRSVITPQQGKSKDDAVKVPSMLNQDRPVNVTSNRLDYDGNASLATFEGNSKLWQDGEDAATINADKIVLDDKTGNLRATTNVVTSTVMKTSDAAGKPKPATKADPTITKAAEMVYENDKHRATYTTGVQMSGPDGTVTSDKLDLFFAEQGGELERAEADGNVVSKQEARRAFGKHLTYNAKDDTYTMTGVPAMVYDDTPPNCKLTKAPTVAFRKEANTGSATGNGTFGQKSEAVACGSGPGSH